LWLKYLPIILLAEFHSLQAKFIKTEHSTLAAHAQVWGNKVSNVLHAFSPQLDTFFSEKVFQFCWTFNVSAAGNVPTFI